MWMIIPIAAMLGLAWELFSEWLLNKLNKPRWKLATRSFAWATLALLAWIISWQDEKADRVRQADSTYLRQQLDTANKALTKSVDLSTAAQKELKTFREQSTQDTITLVKHIFDYFGPTPADAVFHSGLFAQLTGRADEAERAFRQATRMNPKHSRAHNNLGTLLAARSNETAAAFHFEKAYLADTNNTIAAWNHAKRLGLAGREQEALAIIQRPPTDIRTTEPNMCLGVAEYVINFPPTNAFWPHLNNYVKTHDAPDVTRIIPMIALHWISLTPEQKSATSNWVDFLSTTDADKLRGAFPKSP